MNKFNADATFRLSRFAHFIPVSEGALAAYNALTQAVIFGADALFLAIKGLGKQFVVSELTALPPNVSKEQLVTVLEELWQKKLLVMASEDEMADVATLRSALDQPRIQILYLLVTDACNLACHYCFFEGGIPKGYQFSLMTIEAAKAGIDLFARVVDDEVAAAEDDFPTITFYGGEPLLNWPVVSEALDYIAALKAEGKIPANTKAVINTNGTLLTKDIAEKLVRHEVTVALSLDGPKAVHDQVRPFQIGGGSFEAVYKALQLLKSVGAIIGLSVTISWSNLYQMEEITRWLIDDLGITDFGFNALIESAERPVPNRTEYAREVAGRLISCFQVARDRGVLEDRFMRRASTLASGEFYFADCGACGGQVAIAPNGDVGVCHGYCGTREYFVTPTAEFDPRTHPYWQEWLQRSPINMPQCLNCIALANCGGGCPHNASVRTGDIWQVDDTFCPHAKSAVEFLVRDMYAQMQKES